MKILISGAIILMTLFTAVCNDLEIVNAADVPTTSGQVLIEGGATSGQKITSSPKPVGPITLQNPLKIDSVGAAINEGVAIFSYVTVLVAVIMLIWVGLQFILAQGNPDRLKELKMWLYYIIIGLAIIIGARLIIRVVINTLDSTNLIDKNVIQSANQVINTNGN